MRNDNSPSCDFYGGRERQRDNFGKDSNIFLIFAQAHMSYAQKYTSSAHRFLTAYEKHGLERYRQSAIRFLQVAKQNLADSQKCKKAAITVHEAHNALL
jgi:hypothetical protein